MVYLLLLILLFQFGSSLEEQQLVAIQNSQQTYISYLPLADSCVYNSTGVDPGGVSFRSINQLTVFQSASHLVDVSFWAPVRQGFAMMLVQEQLLLPPYQGICLYASPLAKDLSSRPLILYYKPNQPSICFSSGYTTYTIANNSISFTTDQQQCYAFQGQIASILQQCLANQIKISYLGQQLFLCACIGTVNAFAWNATNQTINTVFQLGSLIQGTIDDITANPITMYPNSIAQNQENWNVGLLTANQTQTYTCQLLINGTANCSSYAFAEYHFAFIVDRAWGFQTAFEQTEIDIILKQASSPNWDFPGEIVSLYVTLEGTIFVESQQASTTYLNVLTSNGEQLANLSFAGQIALYGDRGVVIEWTNGTISEAVFTLPIATIVNQNQTSQQLEIICANNSSLEITYNILWTSMDYPSAYTAALGSNTFFSQNSVYSLRMQDNYVVIGPAFEVFLNSNSSVSITVIDESLIELNFLLLDVVHVSYWKQLHQMPTSITYLTLGSQVAIYDFSTRTSSILLSYPCQNDAIKGRKVAKGFVFVSSSNSYCYCAQNLGSCAVLSVDEVVGLVHKSSRLYEVSSLLDYLAPPKQISELKAELFGLLKFGIVVTVFTNNSVVVVNLQQDQFYGIVTPSCSPNQTQAATFARSIYDNVLIVYCQQSPNITQYLIRNNQLLFNRVIPLYGFLTGNQSVSCLSGANFLFLEVDIDWSYNQNLFLDRSLIRFCCVLRLQVTTFTVSVIQEIVYANQVVAVISISGIDIAFYNDTLVVKSNSFLKLYFTTEWISFNQSNSDCTSYELQTYSYQVAFSSTCYNFAAIYDALMVFNLTSTLLAGDFSRNFIALLSYNVSDAFPEYFGDYPFTFNQICGPVSNYYQLYQQQQDALFVVTTKNVVIPAKMVGSISDQYRQLLDLADDCSNTSLSELLLIVSDTKVDVYNKLIAGNWFVFLSSIPTPQSTCDYFVYSLLDNTTVVLGSNCYLPNTNSSTPLLTLFYSSGQLTYSFATMILPINLQMLVSLPQEGSPPYLIGLREGPSKSFTGRLQFCQQYCKSLYLSSKVVFLIDFEAIETDSGIYIVGIDVQNISIWMNLTTPDGSNTVVSPDYTFNYLTVLGESCSIVSIIVITQVSALLLLGGQTYFFELNLIYDEGEIQVLNMFRKYINCEPINKFKPKFWISEDNSGKLLAIECQQSVATLRLGEFQTINSSNSNIVTGYLQIYSPSGPRCGNNVQQPIRLLPLSSSMFYPLYTIYTVNNIPKLLYEEINGFIIDCFISMTPFARYSFSPMTKVPVFPVVNLIAQNDYCTLNFSIQTMPQLTNLEQSFQFGLAILFIVVNLLTLLCIICWVVYGKSKLRANIVQLKDSLTMSETSEATDKSQRRTELNKVEQPVTQGKPKPRKMTEIELFQPIH